MRTIIFFTIVVVTGSTMFGDNNCCEQCCEYLENCCKKEEFYLKKTKADNPEEINEEINEGIEKEIKKLVNPNWYEAKKKTASFILYKKIDGAGNQNLNENDVIKVTKYKNEFRINKNFITKKNN